MITKNVIITSLDGETETFENVSEQSGLHFGGGSVYGLIYFDGNDMCHRVFRHMSGIKSIEEIQETTESEARKFSKKLG